MMKLTILGSGTYMPIKTPLRREIKKHFSSTVTVARDLLSVRLPAQE